MVGDGCYFFLECSQKENQPALVEVPLWKQRGVSTIRPIFSYMLL